MTTPSKSTTAKSTSRTVVEKTPVETPEVIETPKVIETPEVKEVEEVTGDSRIPEILSAQSIMEDFAKRYLSIADEIAEYNKAVLAEKSSEWNASKVLDKSKELASPTDANVPANTEIKAARDAWEKLVGEAALARKVVIDVTAKALGINLAAVADRDLTVEGPLKDRRKMAYTIGEQLNMISGLTTDPLAKDAVIEFLLKNPLPSVGRDQARSFGGDSEKSTPKYRVHVKITKGEQELLSEDGFTKSAAALTKPVFGYPRGEAPKSDKLRAAWEAVGNTAETTVQSVVEFDDNGLHYTLTKRQ